MKISRIDENSPFAYLSDIPPDLAWRFSKTDFNHIVNTLLSQANCLTRVEGILLLIPADVGWRYRLRLRLKLGVRRISFARWWQFHLKRKHYSYKSEHHLYFKKIRK